jgi:hypothetical protein
VEKALTVTPEEAEVYRLGYIKTLNTLLSSKESLLVTEKNIKSKNVLSKYWDLLIRNMNWNDKSLPYSEGEEGAQVFPNVFENKNKLIFFFF